MGNNFFPFFKKKNYYCYCYYHHHEWFFFVFNSVVIWIYLCIDHVSMVDYFEATLFRTRECFLPNKINDNEEIFSGNGSFGSVKSCYDLLLYIRLVHFLAN